MMFEWFTVPNLPSPWRWFVDTPDDDHPWPQHTELEKRMNISAQYDARFTAPQAHNSGADLPMGATPEQAWRWGFDAGKQAERKRKPEGWG